MPLIPEGRKIKDLIHNQTKPSIQRVTINSLQQHFYMTSYGAATWAELTEERPLFNNSLTMLGSKLLYIKHGAKIKHQFRAVSYLNAFTLVLLHSWGSNVWLATYWLANNSEHYQKATLGWFKQLNDVSNDTFYFANICCCLPCVNSWVLSWG